MISPNELAKIVADAALKKKREQGRVLVAIDGRCAAGKTTLARELGLRLSCPVIHMDHFFLRPEQRTRERLATPGENVDHERFLDEVLLPIRRGEAAVYRPFDCHTMGFVDPIRVESSEIAVIEGSYSCHSALFEYYDLRVFLTLSPEEQRKRIEERNGKEALESFVERWIPLEERYFSAFDIECRCDLHFGT